MKLNGDNYTKEAAMAKLGAPLGRLHRPPAPPNRTARIHLPPAPPACTARVLARMR